MTDQEIIELDEDAELIDLGVASLETEGGGGTNYESAGVSNHS